MGTKLGKCIFMLVSLLCLAGCGKGEDGTALEGQGVASARTGAADGENLYINEFIPLQFEDPDVEFQQKTFFYDTYGSRLYVLWAYAGQEGIPEHLSLFTFDGEDKKLEQQPFSLNIPDRQDSYIQSVNVRDGGQLSFRMRDSEGDFLVITDMEGNILSRQETFPDQEEYPWNPDMLHRYENRAFDTGDGTVILSRCKTQENVTELFLYDVEQGKEAPLAVFDGELVRSLCMDGADTMYYTDLESLSRWDRAGNTRTRLLGLHENGISASPVSNNLLMNSQGELLVCQLERDIPGVFVLSGEENHKDDKLRIAYFTTLGSDNLARPANIFFQSYPELELVQERCENDLAGSDARNRILMELTAGGRGPDLMWVREEDMYTFQEKGLLMDMSGLIPEDIQEQIWPGVIQAGTVDNQLVGMKLYASYSTIIVSDTLWKEDSWTQEDLLEIMESKENWDVAISYEHLTIDPYAIGPYELLSGVLLTDLDGSEYLDMEQGYCNFDSPEFIRLLEVCKKYGQTNPVVVDREEHSRQLETGDSIAWAGTLGGIEGFSSYMNMYGNGAHIVGFPTREGGKNYLMPDNAFLVVNARAEHLEEIKALLACLLGYKNQFGYSNNSIRKDVIRDCVVYDYHMGKYVLKLSTKEDDVNVIVELDLKPDGTSWQEEYLSFLETCEPAQNWRYTTVGAILSEELQPYFAGDKSAQEVAGIIQSRVRLYLDERG